MQNQEAIDTHLAANTPFTAENGDFSLSENDDDREKEYDFNDFAIAPISGNAVSGRNNTQTHFTRTHNSRRAMNRYCLSGLSAMPSKIMSGNFTDIEFILFPSGLYSNINHFINLRKFLI